jgi:hypothetical protein
MTECPNCKSLLRKEIEKVYEIDDVKYFDLRLECDACGFSKPATVSRKNAVPKAPDATTEMAASLKLREYMPRRKEGGEAKPRVRIKGESLKKMFSPIKHTKKIFIYGGAVLLGLAVEIGGLYFESYLRTIRADPLVGFLISLLIFIFGPILIVGSAVYYLTGDRLKAILLGSIAVPLTIILLANLRLEQWGL